MNKKEFTDDNYCFVCGESNPIGLKQRFSTEDDELVTYFSLRKEFQGWDGVAHGGILGTLLDEVQVNLLGNMGIQTVTAEITVRLKKPVLINQKYRCAAKLESELNHSKLIMTSANITDENGTIYCQSKAKLIRLGNWDQNKIRIDKGNKE